MVILTNCLTEKLDEGCLKVANQLTVRIKKRLPDTTIVSCGEKTEKSDIHLNLNKLFLNGSLWKLLRERSEPLLYIPFSSNTMASVMRTFILSLYTRGHVNVLYVLQHPMHPMVQRILRWSGSKVFVLSQRAKDFFEANGNQTAYIKAGVDLRKFSPVSLEKKRELRGKYRIPQDKRVVLHVGHLNLGRNVQTLCLLPEEYFGILVCSPRGKQDQQLRKMLESRPNIRIMDDFLESVQEIYQLSDVYLFPVLADEHCIDAPLSALEAAACNLPVVATAYGELAELQKESGFVFVSKFSKEILCNAIESVCVGDVCANRKAVEQYSWDKAVETLIMEISP